MYIFYSNFAAKVGLLFTCFKQLGVRHLIGTCGYTSYDYEQAKFYVVFVKDMTNHPFVYYGCPSHICDKSNQEGLIHRTQRNMVSSFTSRQNNPFYRDSWWLLQWKTISSNLLDSEIPSQLEGNLKYLIHLDRS